MSKKRLRTELITTGRQWRYTQAAVNPIIQRASSLVFDTVDAKEQATKGRETGSLFYGRRGTLTHFALQETMVEMEGGAGCYLYPCGTAAIANAILAFVAAGDHILVTETAYEPTQVFCHQVLSRLNIKTDYFPSQIGANITDFIQPNTKVVFLESPGSITMEIQDIPAIVQAVRSVNSEIVIIVDNTWAAGVLFKPLDYGADISIQAATKYIIGHSDGMLGTAVSNARCLPRLREQSYLMGQICDADTAYLAARGIRTLLTRLKQHQESSIKIAKWLITQPQVAHVYHPALPQHKGHQIYQRDFSGCNGLFSFVLTKKLSKPQLAHFLDHFTLFTMAYSWGGFESLILAYQPEEIANIRPATGVDFTGTLIRVHIGLEDPDDLIADLAIGLQRITP